MASLNPSIHTTKGPSRTMSRTESRTTTQKLRDAKGSVKYRLGSVKRAMSKPSQPLTPQAGIVDRTRAEEWLSESRDEDVQLVLACDEARMRVSEGSRSSRATKDARNASTMEYSAEIGVKHSKCTNHSRARPQIVYTSDGRMVTSRPGWQ